MPREKKHEDAAAKQAAYRARRKAGDYTIQKAKWDILDLQAAVNVAKKAGDTLAADIWRETGRDTLRALIDWFEAQAPKPNLTDL